MKIAINKSGDSFTERWIKYCEENNIKYKIVDSYRNDIIEQIKDCAAFMWHHSHMDSKDILFAKQLLFSLESAGKIVFPDFKSSWHFDDKVGQKYLLEALGINLVPSYVFYEKKEAIKWVGETSFPKVFKLRGGSGSSHVRLVNNKNKALKLVEIAFNKGFSQYNKFANLKERYRKYKLGKANWYDLVKGVIRIFHPTNLAKTKGNERGYIYFQDFIAENSSDYRVIVINKKAFAIKRMVRENDFRASGSGNIIYTKAEFTDQLIKESFAAANRLGSNCIAFDYVVNDGTYLLVEISYGFNAKGYDPCEGYWDENLNFHPGPFNPQGWMVESVVKAVQEKVKPSRTK